MHELDDTKIEHLTSASAELSSAERERTLEAMFLMAAADGDVSEIEIRAFARSCKKLGVDLTEAALETRFLDLHQAIEREGWDARVATVGASLAGTAHAETAYRLAVSVALADDYVVGEEMHAMDALAKALGLDDDRAHAILREVHDALFAG